MALPDLYLYYMAGKLKYLGPGTTSSIPVTPHLHLASQVNLFILWPISEKFTIHLYSLLPMLSILESKTLAQYHDIPAETPLWHKICLDQLIYSQHSMFWSSHGIYALNQLYSSNSLL